MKIHAVYSRQMAVGYGRMAYEIHQAIARQGVEIERWKPNDNSATHLLFMTVPQRPEGWYKGQHVSLLSMWETTQLPLDFLEGLPHFNTLFVPSRQNKEIFGKVNSDTHQITLGCNYDQWKYTPRQPSELFTVITAGAGHRRKGIDISLRVFKRFQARLKAEGYPAARLIIKSKVSVKTPSPDIVILDEHISTADEINLYEKAHVYLGLSRGEGWGMIPHQTIAQGIPTILTDAHGHKGFSHYGIGVKWDYIPADTDIMGRWGEWWEPNEDDALDALWQVYTNYEAHLITAKLSAEACLKTLTWDRTAQMILEHLPANTNEITNEWVKCPQAKLLLRVKQAIPCTIGGQEFNFEPGQDYQVTADVKRVLYDAGYLDESCLDAFEKATFQPPKQEFIDEGLAA